MSIFFLQINYKAVYWKMYIIFEYKKNFEREAFRFSMILNTLNFLGLKNVRKYKKNFRKIFLRIFRCQKCKTFVNLYIKMYRIIFWIDFGFGLGLANTWDPDPIHTFFGGEMSAWE